MATKSPAKKKVQLVMTIGDQTYKTQGDTILDAVSRVKPTNLLGIGQVTIIRDGKESAIPVRFNKYKLERIFNNQVELELFAKRLETLA